ncbi:DUF3278 domain-containing protein [Apilactobacillus kunkeei]|uniref:Uncharacterized protein n=1 Tax=Apilactobacillus kunkeei TaxID=148814 RepID=A0A0M9DCI6_9LACO|nr:DUF3278 domain-containing protein [Apilactobacillus kunkeei]KOY78109.1 hypothetical protein RZ72_02360 [Apilactobacillus kunkeei]
MKESFFVKVVKFIYGINKPFDKFAKKVIYEASFKVVVIIMPLIFVSSIASLGLMNLYDPSLILFTVTIFNLISTAIALGYIERIVRNYGLDVYEYNTDKERKNAIKYYIIKSVILLIFICILFIVSIPLTSFKINVQSISLFVVYSLLFFGTRYADYRRKFK